MADADALEAKIETDAALKLEQLDPREQEETEQEKRQIEKAKDADASFRVASKLANSDTELSKATHLDGLTRIIPIAALFLMLFPSAVLFMYWQVIQAQMASGASTVTDSNFWAITWFAVATCVPCVGMLGYGIFRISIKGLSKIIKPPNIG